MINFYTVYFLDKSRKGSHFYEANDFIDEEMDSNSKRKGKIVKL